METLKEMYRSMNNPDYFFALVIFGIIALVIALVQGLSAMINHFRKK